MLTERQFAGGDFVSTERRASALDVRWASDGKTLVTAGNVVRVLAHAAELRQTMSFAVAAGCAFASTSMKLSEWYRCLN